MLTPGLFPAQLVPHLASAVQATTDRRARVHAADVLQHDLVAGRPSGQRPGLRRVVRRRGDPVAVLAQHRADRLDPEPLPMIVDERHYRGSRGSSPAAKNPDALLRISFARRLLVLALERLEPLPFIARQPGPLTLVDLDPTHPLADRLRRRVQLVGNRTDRFPLRRRTALRFEHHPYRTITQLGRIPPRTSLL